MLLSRLDQDIEATQIEMAATGVIKKCADCAVNAEGTCCGARTAYKCSSILLFINLLLGKALPIIPDDIHLCHFLTKRGCALRARHVICVNFVCQRLMDIIPHDDMCRLQEVAGKEIDSLFALEEYLLNKIGFDALSRFQGNL